MNKGLDCLVVETILLLHYYYTGEVIPGLEVAVKSMKRTERSQFLVSSEYGFGKLGCPPRIPPNATSESLALSFPSGEGEGGWILCM